MTASILPDAPGAPAALTAFLRGIERRGAVFAELLCGDPIRGDAALAVAMRAFCRTATQAPVADWPRRLWSLLLAVPQLRNPVADARWPPPLSTLARLAPGARAVVLLRLVAGLDDADAAAVLGIAAATQRLALRAAQPRRADGSPDAAAWNSLAAALQLMLRQLPAARTAHLAQLRLAAAGGPDGASLQPRREHPHGHRAHDYARWRTALQLGVACCAIAFAATFLLPSAGLRDDAAPIHAVPLPAADAPASTFDAAAAALTHRDFGLLVDSRQDAVVRDLDFYAWYAAQLASQPVATPVLLPDAGMPATDPAGQAPHAR